MNESRQVCGVVAAAFSVGCSLAPVPEPFPIALRVVSDPGEGLGGAIVAQGELAPQVSDASGVVTALVYGREGDTVAVVVRCPDGYQSPDDALAVVLRRFSDPAAVPLQEVTCPPLSRMLVVAVRAPGAADLPVLVDGQELARTDTRGVAHVSRDLPLGKTVELILDTSARPDLEPRSPRRNYGDLRADEVVVFETHFEHRKPPKRPSGGPERWTWGGDRRGHR